MTKYLQERLLDHVLRQVPYRAPSELWLAIYKTPVDDNGKGTEMAGNGYTRQRIDFAGKVQAGFAKNLSEVRFMVAKEDWGDAVELAVMDAETGGNVLFHGVLARRKRIEKGDQIRFAPGDVSMQVEAV